MPAPPTEPVPQYDVIVVGAGAAGAPLAARLSEDSERTVLLLEAGPIPTQTSEFPPELLDAGTLQGARPDHPNNWSFLGYLTPDLPYSIARGKILGGSSAVNGGYFVRARREDFERWAEGGNDEWAYEKVLPFLRRLEADAQFGQAATHGASGPMPVTRQPQDHPAARAFRAAALALGYPSEPDKNGQAEPGIGPVPVNVVDGVRWNTGIAYINPARGRPNLTVQGDSFVRRVVFDGIRAVGVEVERPGEIEIVTATEIVLSAGGVKSPHLLMLSGIGPRAELESVGIRVVHDSPGVGKNFSDHPEVSVGWRPRRDIVDLRSPQVLTHMLNFTAAGSDGVSDLEILQMVKPTGYLLTGRSQVVASGLATLLRHPLRSLQSVRGVSRRRLAQQLTHHADLSFIVAVQAETSRGNITLESADPSTPPRIDYNYLSTESDRSRMREAVRVTVRILRSQAFAPLFGRLTELEDRTLDDDALLDAWMLTHLGTAIHLCGSARFGGAGDRGAVVDQYGRVHGVEGLRVADTSILPSTPTRGPAATAVLIGELVADFIRRGAY